MHFWQNILSLTRVSLDLSFVVSANISLQHVSIHAQTATPLGCVARTAVGWKTGERKMFSRSRRGLCIAAKHFRNRAAVVCGYREESNHFCASSWLEVNFWVSANSSTTFVCLEWNHRRRLWFGRWSQATRVERKRILGLQRASRSQDRKWRIKVAALSCDHYFSSFPSPY